MLDVRCIKSNALRLFARGEPTKLKVEWQPRVRRILFLLDAAVHPEDLKMHGYGFRALAEDREDSYAVQLAGSMHVTYKWSAEGHPVDVDLEKLNDDA